MPKNKIKVKAYTRRAPKKRQPSRTKKPSAQAKPDPLLVAFVVFAFFAGVRAVFAAEGTETFTFEEPRQPLGFVIEAPTSTPPVAPVALVAPRAPAPRAPGQPSQAQKDATASVCRKVGENRLDMLSAQGVSLNAFLSSCYYDLLAIAKQESGYDCQAVGDSGKSRGCFQIQTKLHGLTVAHAEDYALAAEWTLDRMVRDTGYPTYRHASIRRHNGAGPKAEAYTEKVKARASDFKAAGL